MDDQILDGTKDEVNDTGDLAVTVADSTSGTAKADEFLNLEELIKNYAGRIDQIKEDLKKQKQMLDDALEGDAVYQEHAEKAKEANKIKSATKQQILKQPALMEIAEKVKDLKFDISEHEAMLNDYLQQYQKLSGATQIDLGNGEFMEIVSVVRLVRRKKGE